jgi:hypothetical protein
LSGVVLASLAAGASNFCDGAEGGFLPLPPPDIFLTGGFEETAFEELVRARAAGVGDLGDDFFTSLITGFLAGFLRAGFFAAGAGRFAVTFNLGFALGFSFALAVDFAVAFFAAALRLLAISFLPFVSPDCCHHHHMQPP